MAIYTGQVTLFALDYAPVGFAICNGQLLSCTKYSALFSLIGTTYGGDGVKTFALPDLRGRAVKGRSPGRAMGTKTGSELVKLDANTMASHAHTIQASTRNADRRDPNSSAFATAVSDGRGNFYAAPDALVALADISIPLSSDYNMPHANMQPFVALNYCIALTGLFPPRGSVRSAQPENAA